MMRFTKFFAPIAAILLANVLYSQSNSEGYSVKAYSNFAYSDEPKNEFFFKDNLVKSYESQYDLGYFTPAFTLNNEKGNFHEFEISRVKFSSGKYTFFNEDSAGTIGKESFIATENSLHLALRYEYALKLNLGSESSRLIAYLGFAGSPYFKTVKIKPEVSESFSESQSQLGLVLSVVPHITYSLSPKWYLDLNLPISVVDVAYINFKTSDPVYQLEQRKISTSELSTFPSDFLVRFGIGFKI